MLSTKTWRPASLALCALESEADFFIDMQSSWIIFIRPEPYTMGVSAPESPVQSPANSFAAISLDTSLYGPSRARRKKTSTKREAKSQQLKHQSLISSSCLHRDNFEMYTVPPSSLSLKLLGLTRPNANARDKRRSKPTTKP